MLYAATVRPFDSATLRAALRVAGRRAGRAVPGGNVGVEVAGALADLPHRVLGLGVGRAELRRYGTPAEHQAAHGLDAVAARRITGFLGAADQLPSARSSATPSEVQGRVRSLLT